MIKLRPCDIYPYDAQNLYMSFASEEQKRWYFEK